MVLKILSANLSKDEVSKLEIERFITEKNPSHQGHASIRACLGQFEFDHNEKKHTGLVYEPMREPMTVFQKRWPDRKIPLAVAKAYIYLLLLAMDYLHTECRVVHTGEPPFSLVLSV